VGEYSEEISELEEPDLDEMGEAVREEGAPDE